MGLRAVRRQLVKRYAGRNSGHAPRSALEGCRVIRPERIVIQSSVTIGGTIINKGEKLTVAGVVDEARVYGLYQGGRPQIFVRAGRRASTLAVAGIAYSSNCGFVISVIIEFQKHAASACP